MEEKAATEAKPIKLERDHEDDDLDAPKPTEMPEEMEKELQKDDKEKEDREKDTEKKEKEGKEKEESAFVFYDSKNSLWRF